MSETPTKSPRPIARPLILRMVAAMVLGCLAAIGEFQAWQHAPGPAQALPAARDGKIVAGQRVDFITLNLPMAEVEARLGAGKVRPQTAAQLYIYDQLGISVAAQEGLVQSILVQNPNMRTVQDLGVGSDVDRVVRAFGRNYEYEGRGSKAYSLHYWSQGIHFTVQSTRVVNILVSQPLSP